jgi:hypothetical protein
MTMSRFRSLSLHTRSLCPTDAEIWVLAEADPALATAEIRGRLVGPTCEYATTIEVAYPLQPFPKLPEGLPPLARRVVIPEPSLWAPPHPFLYHGSVELWAHGACLERREVRHGLRSARLGPDGLVWNGQRLKLNAAERAELLDDQLARLHRDRCNALVLPAQAGTLWERAERLGFVGIGRLDSAEELESIHFDSPACLGWLLPLQLLGRDPAVMEWVKTMSRVHRRFVGVELEKVPEQNLPDEITFVVGRADLPPIAALPRLLRGREGELGRFKP